MVISDFTKPELDYFRENCNFVNYEIIVFNERAEGVPLERIAEQLNISYDYVRHLSRKVNKKIISVLYVFIIFVFLLNINQIAISDFHH